MVNQRRTDGSATQTEEERAAAQAEFQTRWDREQALTLQNLADEAGFTYVQEAQLQVDKNKLVDSVPDNSWLVQKILDKQDFITYQPRLENLIFTANVLAILTLLATSIIAHLGGLHWSIYFFWPAAILILLTFIVMLISALIEGYATRFLKQTYNQKFENVFDFNKLAQYYSVETTAVEDALNLVEQTLNTNTCVRLYKRYQTRFGSRLTPGDTYSIVAEFGVQRNKEFLVFASVFREGVAE